MNLYRVIHVIPIVEHVSQVFIQPIHSDSLIYEAGQFVEVIHDHHASPLSIACAPNDSGILEFHLFHPVKNPVARAMLRMAHEEKTWSIKGPFGICTIKRLHPDKPIIFLAQGTGFAPIKAIIEAMTPPYPNIHFYWSVPEQADIYLLDLLEKWQMEIPNFMFKPVFTSGFQDKEMMNIHLLKDTVLINHAPLNNFQVYASGPKPLVQAAFSIFVKHGLNEELFYSDVI